jgi:hypothetical protein
MRVAHMMCPLSVDRISGCLRHLLSGLQATFPVFGPSGADNFFFPQCLDCWIGGMMGLVGVEYPDPEVRST